MYAKRLSLASSNSDYPSSLSTLHGCALGLTNSPRSMATPSTPSSGRLREQRQKLRPELREVRSSASIRSETVSRPSLERSNATTRNGTPKPKIPRKRPPMIENWEEELARKVNDVNIGSKSDTPRGDQARKDAEWEQQGMWEAQQASEGQAEDRTRREAGRDIGE